MRVCAVLLLMAGMSAAAVAEDYRAAKPGELLQVRLEQLHPTQAVVGYDQIFYKLGRFVKEPNKLFDEYCEGNGQGESSKVPKGASLHQPDSFSCQGAVGSRSSEMKTVVVGPEGQLYLTDGHHTFTTLWEQGQGGAQLQMWVRVTDNFSDSSDMASFWQRMQAERKVWLKDGQGQAITPEQIPAQLGFASLGNDPYRALVYFTREVAYDKPRSGEVAPEFLEFYWGNWLRQRLSLQDYALDEQGSYRDAVAAAAQLMVAQEPDAALGDSGFTPRQLGGYSSVDRKELSKMASKKLGYMIQYKAAR
ncbi:MAG: ParB/Srx family N-terminal domain-containing protein [Gammaproteobacteria bacterium]|nr:ParB/Srx family N-terminal domain-containing protein [Gammaproteobacteria bacterium]MBU1488161.1 ParB/Srx family N-terminal domain-containing protein [Gammaproteobacteria bacterium]MBU2066172.1 ParB/Srx family N-terminal domain-containing protein [Gammaproteobacteria bacterium]MBU2139459.1 ParB/Srx family N-terminal domain-containing protein [Gammaproteobacteria bacterium]MBU2215713.1 ParB/Srx family N-terminal domain-containing protein [Gammaproteobacteria bacterium]